MAGLAIVLATPAAATWYGENVANGSDIMMMDVRWPWWPESTYFANFNFATNPSGLSGYGGFAISGPIHEPDHLPNFDPALQAALRPGSVWSFWGAGKDGEPVRVASTSPYCYPHQYIGEGASGSLGGPAWPFISQNHWYRMMMRVWSPIGVKNPQYSYMGRWVKDVDSNAWHLYGIMRLPIPVTSFTGNAGFLEDYGNAGRSVRSMHRRLGYCRKDGKWLKSDTVTYDVPAYRGQLDTYWVVNIQPEGDHEVLEMELSSNKSMLPQKLTGQTLELGKKTSFTVKQPDSPILDPAGVAGVKAVSTGHQVAVSWGIPPSAAPQLAYKVEVFDNPRCKGTPRVIKEERMPTTHSVLLDSELLHPTVRLTITDVFDQPSHPTIINCTSAGTPEPSRSGKTAAGLQYELIYQDSSRKANVLYPPSTSSEMSRDESHNWLSLAELSAGKHIQSGVSRGFDVDLRGDRANAYGFRFYGLLRTPQTGLYQLHMLGSDGYRIRIDNRDALVWDGIHGPTEKTAFVHLAKGDHALGVAYFVDQAPAPFFKLEWEGPGISLQEIPASDLIHRQTDVSPELTMTAASHGNGTGYVFASVQPKGHQVNKLQLFLGKLQIAESADSILSFTGPLLQGKNMLWTRLTYDKDHTIDSDPTTVDIQGEPIKDWSCGVAGEDKARRGLWQTGPDSFSFIGEGEFVLSKKVHGDFTLTCRVDSFAGSKGEPVNPSSWVGLSAREDASKNNSGWGREFGLMQTGGEGLRATPNFSDLGGGRVSDFELPKGRPWLRIVRSGNQWTAWTSMDGQGWRFACTHYIPARPDMDAGVVFRALPQDARAYFQAKVSHLSVEQGGSKELDLLVPIAAKDASGPRLSGVVVSTANSKVVVARSTNKGLFRSVDGGSHWVAANGTLQGANNSVRSVAIHPNDPNIMVRANGQIAADGTFEGGLFITKDGGTSWQKLNFPGDFDGAGPSALCGEVVSFDPKKPETIFVGCETKGFYRSEDRGATWKLIGAAGQRVTAVAVNYWVRGNDDNAMLHIVTCPDRWMTLLGRGFALANTKDTNASDYLSRDGGRTLAQVCNRSDLGYYNVSFDRGSWPSEIPYATSHGVLKSLAEGEISYLFPPEKNLESFRPTTALACSGLPEAFRGRTVSMALDPANPGQISVSDQSAFSWNWQSLAGDKPTAGMISISGEIDGGMLWWLLSTDGLYRSLDGAKTLVKVLDPQGSVVSTIKP